MFYGWTIKAYVICGILETLPDYDEIDRNVVISFYYYLICTHSFTCSFAV